MLFFQAVVNIKDGREEKVVYIKEDEFVGIVKAHAGEDELTAFLYAVFDDLNLDESVYLDQLDHVVAQKIRDLDLPAGLDLSLGLLSGKRLLLKTMGEGVVYGLRGNDSAKIIEGDRSAVGKVLQGDWFIFTFKSEGSPKMPDAKIEFEEFSKNIHRGQSVKATALYANISILGGKRRSLSAINMPKISGFKKGFQLLAVVVVFSLLAGSVFLGYRKRERDKAFALYNDSKAQIQSLISKAEEEVFLSPQKAEELINEARKKTQQLRDSLPDRYDYLAKELEDKINEKRSEIFREREKDLEEFFDINLIAPGKKGDLLRLAGGYLGIRTEDSRFYVVNLESKKNFPFDKKDLSFKFADIMISGNDFEVVGFFERKLFSVADDAESFEILVEDDESWGEIVDLSVYGKNIYLLDAEKNQLYKHTPVQDGYSGALEYFQADIEISDQARLAIDGSVYIADGGKIYRFFRGRKEDFIVSVPVEEAVFDDVYTDPDTDFVYILDKKNKYIYVINKKTSDFEEQITHRIISAADDFVVYQSKPYLLVDDKIYILK